MGLFVLEDGKELLVKKEVLGDSCNTTTYLHIETPDDIELMPGDTMEDKFVPLLDIHFSTTQVELDEVIEMKPRKPHGLALWMNRRFYNPTGCFFVCNKLLYKKLF